MSLSRSRSDADDYSEEFIHHRLDSLIALMGSAQFPLRNDKRIIVASLRPRFPAHDRKSLTGSGATRTGLKFGFDQIAGLAYKIHTTAPQHFPTAIRTAEAPTEHSNPH